MKFRFYIVTACGGVEGTDDQRVANEAATDNLAVIDTDGGFDLTTVAPIGIDDMGILEQTLYVLTPVTP